MKQGILSIIYEPKFLNESKCLFIAFNDVMFENGL